MRSSVILASLCAALSVASPMHKALHKKEYVYDITTEIVYVTVTAGEPLPTTSSTSRHKQHVVTTTVVIKNTVVVGYTPTRIPSTSSSTSTTPPPPPPPSTTSTPPAPTPTSIAPVVVVPETTAPAPVPEPTTQAAVVVPVVAAPTQAAVVVAPVVAPATAASPTDYQGAALWHHNQHRANHSANALSWSSDLASRALQIANTCVFAHDMTVGGGGYGQNLAAYGASDISSASLAGAVADSVTNQWYYGEVANMPYGVDSPNLNGPEFLHLSALLWKSTTTVGCATATCKAGTIFGMASLYTVCNYAAEGNVIGEFASQVGRPIGNAGITASV